MCEQLQNQAQVNALPLTFRVEGGLLQPCDGFFGYFYFAYLRIRPLPSAEEVLPEVV
jgi:hypothetical protein